MITILKSKIRELKIDVCRIEYTDGSITIPKEIMAKANIKPYEKVEVNSKHGKGRIMTYAIPGDQVEMNGGAANHFKEGEIVHVNVFLHVNFVPEGYKPIII